MKLEIESAVETKAMSTQPDLSLRPALDFTLGELATLLNRSFEGYFVTIHDTPELLAQRLRLDSVDLALSRVAIADGQPIGLIYLSPRGWSCRVAGMGVVAEARRQGVGRCLMQEAIATLEPLGYRRLLLEVIAENTGAVALYRELGLTVKRRLLGYELVDDGTVVSDYPEDVDQLTEVDPRVLASLVASDGENDLPWQLAAETFAAYNPPHRVHGLEDSAFALLGHLDDSQAHLQALVVRRDRRRRGWGKRLLTALRLLYPGRRWRVSARVPEGSIDAFMTAGGFSRGTISQLEMEIRF